MESSFKQITETACLFKERLNSNINTIKVGICGKIADILDLHDEYGKQIYKYDRSNEKEFQGVPPHGEFSKELLETTYLHLIGDIYNCIDEDKIEPVDYNNIWTSKKTAFFKSSLLKDVFPVYHNKRGSYTTYVNYNILYKVLMILIVKVKELIICIKDERERLMNETVTEYYSPYNILPIDFRLWILTTFSRSFDCGVPACSWYLSTGGLPPACNNIFGNNNNPISGSKEILCEPKLIKYMGENKLLFEQNCDRFKDAKDDSILLDTVFWQLFTLDYYLANESGSVNVLITLIEEDYNIDQIDSYSLDQIALDSGDL